MGTRDKEIREWWGKQVEQQKKGAKSRGKQMKDPDIVKIHRDGWRYSLPNSISIDFRIHWTPKRLWSKPEIYSNFMPMVSIPTDLSIGICLNEYANTADDEKKRARIAYEFAHTLTQKWFTITFFLLALKFVYYVHA